MGKRARIIIWFFFQTWTRPPGLIKSWNGSAILNRTGDPYWVLMHVTFWKYYLKLMIGHFLCRPTSGHPGFSLLGSKSGFDTLEACFEDLSDHIFAVGNRSQFRSGHELACIPTGPHDPDFKLRCPFAGQTGPAKLIFLIRILVIRA